ncbi:MAG TPA: signal peptidase II [Acidimicrobiales bacterium]|nr:signal peptidase II [Acidimicrobiales bacterium]
MTAPAPARSLTLLSVGIAALVLLLDQLTKSWAVNELAGGRIIDVVGSLRFNLTFNSGMAFSQARGAGPIVGVVALGVIVVLLVSLRRTGSVLSAVGIGLVIGGALGNVADRVFRAGEGFLGGSVVDFIDVQWWPVFNVADMAVTVGGALLVVGSVLAGRERVSE